MTLSSFFDFRNFLLKFIKSTFFKVDIHLEILINIFKLSVIVACSYNENDPTLINYRLITGQSKSVTQIISNTENIYLYVKSITDSHINWEGY